MSPKNQLFLYSVLVVALVGANFEPVGIKAAPATSQGTTLPGENDLRFWKGVEPNLNWSRLGVAPTADTKVGKSSGQPGGGGVADFNRRKSFSLKKGGPKICAGLEKSLAQVAGLDGTQRTDIDWGKDSWCLLEWPAGDTEPREWAYRISSLEKVGLLVFPVRGNSPSIERIDPKLIILFEKTPQQTDRLNLPALGKSGQPKLLLEKSVAGKIFTYKVTTAPGDVHRVFASFYALMAARRRPDVRSASFSVRRSMVKK